MKCLELVMLLVRHLHDHHDYSAALEYLKRSVDIREKLSKKGNPLDLSRSYYLMGRVYDGLGNYPMAVEYFQKAISDATRV